MVSPGFQPGMVGEDEIGHRGRLVKTATETRDEGSIGEESADRYGRWQRKQRIAVIEQQQRSLPADSARLRQFIDPSLRKPLHVRPLGKGRVGIPADATLVIEVSHQGVETVDREMGGKGIRVRAGCPAAYCQRMFGVGERPGHVLDLVQRNVRPRRHFLKGNTPVESFERRPLLLGQIRFSRRQQQPADA